MTYYGTAPALSGARYAVTLDGQTETPCLSFKDIAESVDPDTAKVIAALAIGKCCDVGPLRIRRVS